MHRKRRLLYTFAICCRKLIRSCCIRRNSVSSSQQQQQPVTPAEVAAEVHPHGWWSTFRGARCSRHIREDIVRFSTSTLWSTYYRNLSGYPGFYILHSHFCIPWIVTTRRSFGLVACRGFENYSTLAESAIECFHCIHNVVYLG